MTDLPVRLPDPQRFLTDQMAALQRTLPATIAGNLLLAAVLAWALQGAVPAWVLRATRRRPLTARNAPRRAAAAVRSAGVLGLVWTGGILLLWPAGDASLPQRVLLVFLVAGVSSGELHSLSPHLPTFTAFFVPTVAAVALAALRAGGPTFQAVAGGGRSWSKDHDGRHSRIGVRRPLCSCAASWAQCRVFAMAGRPRR